MFVDNRSQFTPSGLSPDPMWTKPGFKKLMVFLISLMLFGGIAFVWFVSRSNQKIPVVSERPTEEPNPLPGGFLGLTTEDPDKNKQEQVKSEEIFFGDIYKPIINEFKPKTIDIVFPINIKKDVANYYPFTREIALKDDAIAELNSKGYTVIDNPFLRNSNSFLPVYKELNKRNVPFLVTGDFLFYYTQNSLKQIYKNIESDVFFRAFWETNMALFQQSDKRYRDRYAKVGIINDPILEGYRLEAVYFAINLELLRPKAHQIIPANRQSVDVGRDPAGRFSQLEAQEFRFAVPNYLADSVAKELELIAKYGKNGAMSKSPALLYMRDYTPFKVPLEYADNQKLSNFYLASTWTRSSFPLFYIDKDCPSCLLDSSDWLVNQAAAHFIARDLSANQELKNKWAKVYKAIAFFNNLSMELNYLDYDRAFRQLFGKKTVEEVFDTANTTRDQDLKALRDFIASTDYDIAKGGLNRNTEDGRRQSGMRFLQEIYDPAKYVYDTLTFTRVGGYNKYDPKKNYPNLNTLCETGFQKTVRCRAIGLDLLNPVFDEAIDNQYFKVNSDFANYSNLVPELRSHFVKFDTLDWHENLYWTTLDVGRKYLNTRKQANFPYTTTSTWANQALSTVLGATTNSRLPYDNWITTFQQESGQSAAQNIVKYHYIEPNIALISELQASADMLFKTFVKLELVKDNNNEFVELLDDLDYLRRLVVKENAGIDFVSQDWNFINKLVSKYTLKNERDKTWRLKFVNPETKREALLEQSMQGVKLLIEVHRQQSRNVMVVGPVFNFRERKM